MASLLHGVLLFSMLLMAHGSSGGLMNFNLAQAPAPSHSSPSSPNSPTTPHAGAPAPSPSACFATTTVGPGAYASYNNPAQAPFQQALVTNICPGGTWVGSIDTPFVKEVPLWTNSSQAYYKTQMITLGCYNNAGLQQSLYFYPATDAHWDNANYDWDIPSAISFESTGFTSLQLAPASAIGANGPWGNSGSKFGYTGTDAVAVNCPNGQVIVGMTASTSLAGFNYLQVVCGLACRTGAASQTYQPWSIAAGGLSTSNVCDGNEIHNGPGAFTGYPVVADELTFSQGFSDVFPSGFQPQIQTSTCPYGQFISTFNISSATRTTTSGTTPQTSIISYVGAVCTDGTVLTPAVVNTATSSGAPWSFTPLVTAEMLFANPNYGFSTIYASISPNEQDVLTSLFTVNAHGNTPAYQDTLPNNFLVNGFSWATSPAGLIFFDFLALNNPHNVVAGGCAPGPAPGPALLPFLPASPPTQTPSSPSAPFVSYCATPTYFGPGAYAGYNPSSPTQQDITTSICPGGSFVQTLTASYGTHIASWRGANASQANAETVQITMQCSNLQNTNGPTQGTFFQLSTPFDGNYPESPYINTQDQTVSSAGLTPNGLSSLVLAPNTSYGADGPWGQVTINNTAMIGYQGPNPQVASCPAGQLIVGLKTAAASLGGFTYLQIICAPTCWNGTQVLPAQPWFDRTVSGNVCNNITHLGPGAFSAFPLFYQTPPVGTSPIIQAQCSVGNFISSYMVQSAIRTNLGAAVGGPTTESVITYLSATCTDGGLLTPVVVNTTSNASFQWSNFGPLQTLVPNGLNNFQSFQFTQPANADNIATPLPQSTAYSACYPPAPPSSTANASNPACLVTTAVGAGNYTNFNSSQYAAYQQPIVQSLCPGGTFINFAQINWRKRVPLWSGSQSAFYETVAMTFECSNGQEIILSKGSDLLWPTDLNSNIQASQGFPTGLTNMSFAPTTSPGFNGPFAANALSGTFGYSGPNPVLVSCPAGQYAVGVSTASASRGGFDYFQLVCASTCWAGKGSIPTQSSSQTSIGEACKQPSHYGPGALGAYPIGNVTVPAQQNFVQAACGANQWVTSFNLATSNRTNTSTGSVESVISYIAANCSDGTQLTPITIGTNTSDYTFSANSPFTLILPSNSSNSSASWFDHFELRGYQYEDVLQSILGFNEQAVIAPDNLVYPLGGVIGGWLARSYEGGIMYFEFLTTPNYPNNSFCGAAAPYSAPVYPPPMPPAPPGGYPPPNAPGNSISASKVQRTQTVLRMDIKVPGTAGLKNCQPIPDKTYRALLVVLSRIFGVPGSQIFAFLNNPPSCASSSGRRLQQVSPPPAPASTPPSPDSGAVSLGVNINTTGSTLASPTAGGGSANAVVAGANAFANAVSSGTFTNAMAAQGAPGFTISPADVGFTALTESQALSTAPPTPPPPPTPGSGAAPPPAQNSGSKKLSGGAIAGIVIGAVVFVAIVSAIVTTLVILHHNKARQGSPQFMSGQGRAPFAQEGSPASPNSARATAPLN
ncbi:hypothetical protein WJX73_010564 [Symbiochloris irregularis]|uniref:Uncharacterized protein n=1 Tax=Symbiochloris irregularis TaxID=706552 RepID=A0AAW1P5S7_9CHLO